MPACPRPMRPVPDRRAIAGAAPLPAEPPALPLLRPDVPHDASPHTAPSTRTEISYRSRARPSLRADLARRAASPGRSVASRITLSPEHTMLKMLSGVVSVALALPIPAFADSAEIWPRSARRSTRCAPPTRRACKRWSSGCRAPKRQRRAPRRRAAHACACGAAPRQPHARRSPPAAAAGAAADRRRRERLQSRDVADPLGPVHAHVAATRRATRSAASRCRRTPRSGRARAASASPNPSWASRPASIPGCAARPTSRLHADNTRLGGGGLRADHVARQRAVVQGRPLLLRHRLSQRAACAHLGLRRQPARLPGDARHAVRRRRRATALAGAAPTSSSSSAPSSAAAAAFPAATPAATAPAWPRLRRTPAATSATSHSWRAGLSMLNAQGDRPAAGRQRCRRATRSPTAFSGSTRVWIADAVWKWAPNGNATRTNFKLQGEYLRSTRSGSLVYDVGGADHAPTPIARAQSGWYLQGVYQFMPRWRVGAAHRAARLRHARLRHRTRRCSPATATGPRKNTLMLDFSPSEFSRVRLQLARDRARDGSPTTSCSCNTR